MFPSAKNLLILSVACLLGVDGATMEEEISSNSVTLTFYQMSASEWSGVEPDFKTELITRVNAYCQDNKAHCGIKSGIQLQMNSSNYMVANGYPTDEKQNSKVQIYLTIPSSISSGNLLLTQYVLNKQALQSAVIASRSALGQKVGYSITFVDETRYSPPPNTRVNNIIIPIACVLTALIFLLALILYKWHKSEMKKAKKKQREENRNKKRTNMVAPHPHMASSHDRHWNGSAAGTEQWYISESDQNNGSAQNRPPAYHTIEVPDVTNRPGMDDIYEDSNEKRRKDKKKKKHRKHRKHGKDEENGFQNSPNETETEINKPDIEKRQLINDQIQLAAMSAGNHGNNVSVEDSGSEHGQPTIKTTLGVYPDFEGHRSHLGNQGLM